MFLKLWAKCLKDRTRLLDELRKAAAQWKPTATDMAMVATNSPHKNNCKVTFPPLDNPPEEPEPKLKPFDPFW